MSEQLLLPTVPPPITALASSPAMSSVDLLAQATRIVLARHLAYLYEHHEDVATSEDVHAVHQMRVATRRMRAVLGATEEVFKSKITKSLNKRLRRLARLLGVVRDSDVLLLHLRDFAKNLSPEEHGVFDTLIEEVEHQREEGQGKLRSALMAKDYRRTLDELVDFLQAPLNQVASSDSGLPLLVRHRAGSTVLSRYEAVRRYETVLPTATSEQLHDLRIACKHLRYTLELFDAPLGARGAELVKSVKAAQEVLGSIHDSDVGVSFAERTLRKQGTVPAILRYIETRHTERATAAAELPRVWTTLIGETARYALAQALAEL